MPAICHVSRYFPIYAVLAYGISAVVRIVEAVLRAPAYWTIEADMLTQYFVNYPDHGFAKRALVGTFLRPFLGGLEAPEHLVFAVMVALNLAGVGALVWLVQRYLPHREGEGRDTVAILRCGLAMGSLGVMQIAHDLGRLDLLNYALMIGAVAMVARGRVLAASGLCVVGVLVHEGFTVYAAPLVIAVGWQVLRRENGPREVMLRLVPLVAAIAVASVAVLLWGDSESAAALPYGTGGYVWARGLVEGRAALPIWHIAILAVFWVALGAVLVTVWRSRDGADLLLAAAACVLALNFLGIDHARWLTLGFYLVAVVVAVEMRVFGVTPRDPGPVARWLMYPLCLPLGPMGVVSGFAWLPWT